jgi:hypothetical protein
MQASAYFYSSKYETVSNFWFSKHYSALTLISRCVRTQFLDHISYYFLDYFEYV